MVLLEPFQHPEPSQDLRQHNAVTDGSTVGILFSVWVRFPYPGPWLIGPHSGPATEDMCSRLRMLVFQILGFIMTSLSVFRWNLPSPVLCLLCIWNNVQICHSSCHCYVDIPSVFLHPSKFDSVWAKGLALSHEHERSALTILARESKFKLSTA